jgi:hypothetical protein
MNFFERYQLKGIGVNGIIILKMEMGRRGPRIDLTQER